jgi:hypothetical protein
VTSEIVIFTDDPKDEISEVLRHARPDAARRLFVHGAGCDVSAQRLMLPGWTFVVFEEAMANSWVQTENTERDVFVLHECRPAKIPDRNLGMYQMRCVGQKLVVESHPFCGKGEPWYLYFPYSYVNKQLLGYPHCYSFRDASTEDPYEPLMLARKVASASVTYMQKVFGPIETISVSLTVEEHAEYGRLKARLFDEQTTPHAVIRGLKKYVDSTASVVGVVNAQPAPMLPLLNLNRVWPLYQAGARVRVVSDAKVDVYLASVFDDYVDRANRFMTELHRLAPASKARHSAVANGQGVLFVDGK